MNCLQKIKSASCASLRKRMKQISQGKQRETESSTREVQIMTDAMLFAPMHPRKQIKCFADMCQGNDCQATCADDCTSRDIFLCLANIVVKTIKITPISARAASALSCDVHAFISVGLSHTSSKQLWRSLFLKPHLIASTAQIAFLHEGSCHFK